MLSTIRFNRTLTQIERGFNVADSLPIVSIITSPLRIVAGKIQAIFGLIMSAAALLYRAFFGATHTYHAMKRIGHEHMIQGAFNIIRGFGETLLAAATFTMGNMVLLGLQEISENGFDPIEPYYGVA